MTYVRAATAARCSRTRLRDAHGFYQQFGFRELSAPERLMEIVVRDPYGGSGSEAAPAIGS